jgi:hypothetical protein
VGATEMLLRPVLTDTETRTLNGQTVAHREPNLTEATIARHADTGEPLLAYLPIPGGVADLRAAVRGIDYATTYRGGSGMRNVSRTFGMAPRKPIQQREACRAASLAYEQPDEHAVLVSYATRMRELLEEVLPDQAHEADTTLTAVDDEWRIGKGELWTSGVVNRTSTLPYHRDGFNFDSWSAMPVVRRGIAGGHLDVPQWGITVECRDGWAVLFNGFRHLHGVTPMTTRQRDGYRYSVVFYALRGMKDCHTYAVEQGDARRRRTEREGRAAQ